MDHLSSSVDTSARVRIPIMIWSTLGFTLLFNVWLMLGVLSTPIQKALGLTDSQKEWLLSAAILAGALPRLNFGIWADKYGGRIMMIGLLMFCAVPTYLFSLATSYPQMIALALLFGLAGNGFTIGIAWNSAWFPPESKGLALGVLGAGNVGASGTKLLLLLVPSILTIVPAAGYLGGWIPGGWRIIPAVYSVLLVLMAVALHLFTARPDRAPGAGRPLGEMLSALKYVRVWRFSLYYVVVFGAYVALSAWLPGFYVKTYGISLHDAALLTTTFIFPASLLRPVGGWLSDMFGPRPVTYAVFLTMSAGLTLLSIPNGTYFGVDYKLGAYAFAGLMFVVGSAMGIGKASVYKYVPNYFPNDVGAVGGMVGMLGALGGFALPPVFGIIGRATGVPQLACGAMLVLTLVSLTWLHITVLGIKAEERREAAGAIPAGLNLEARA